MNPAGSIQPAEKRAALFLKSAFVLMPLLCLAALFMPRDFPAGAVTLRDPVLAVQSRPVLFRGTLSGEAEPAETFFYTRGVLIYRLRSAYLTTAEGVRVRFLPDLFMRDENASPEYAAGIPGVLYCALVGVFLLAAAAWYFRSHLRTGAGCENLEKYFLIFFLCALQYALMLIFRMRSPDVFMTEADASGYFAAVRQLLDGDFHAQSRYTIGLGFVYLPFILVTGARNVSEISSLIAPVAAVLVYPAAVSLLFLTMRRYLKSALIPFCGTAAWLLLCNLFILIEKPFRGGIFSPFGILHTAGSADYIYNSYMLVLHSLNQLSEPWSFLAAALTFFSAWKIRRPLLRACLCGTLFAFACLIRLNNLLFAPLLFLLFLKEDGDFFRNFRHTVAVCAAGALCFLLLFSLQFLLNFLQFGHAFRFPYCLHDPALYRGFQLENLARSTDFYFRCFAPVLALAAAGILTCADAGRRAFCLLGVFPMAVFFCGISELGQNYRFLYPVYAMALTAGCCSVAWPRMDRTGRLILILFLVLLTVPVWPVRLCLSAPRGSSWLEQWEFLRSWYALLLSGILLFYFSGRTRRNLPAIAFALLYGLFLTLPPGPFYPVFFGVLCAVPLYRILNARLRRGGSTPEEPA